MSRISVLDLVNSWISDPLRRNRVPVPVIHEIARRLPEGDRDDRGVAHGEINYALRAYGEIRRYRHSAAWKLTEAAMRTLARIDHANRAGNFDRGAAMLTAALALNLESAELVESSREDRAVFFDIAMEQGVLCRDPNWLARQADAYATWRAEGNLDERWEFLRDQYERFMCDTDVREVRVAAEMAYEIAGALAACSRTREQQRQGLALRAIAARYLADITARRSWREHAIAAYEAVTSLGAGDALDLEAAQDQLSLAHELKRLGIDFAEPSALERSIAIFRLVLTAMPGPGDGRNQRALARALTDFGRLTGDLASLSEAAMLFRAALAWPWTAASDFEIRSVSKDLGECLSFVAEFGQDAHAAIEAAAFLVRGADATDRTYDDIGLRDRRVALEDRLKFVRDLIAKFDGA